MRRMLLNTLSLAVIAIGGTALPANGTEAASDWSICFNACLASGHSYDYCRADCRVFEPQQATPIGGGTEAQ